MRAVIVTGGTPPTKELLLKYIKEDDYIIGVDKGCNCLYQYKIKPNIILGDFDSIDSKIIDYYKASNIEIIEFEPEKDYTDTDLGYRKAVASGAKEILLFGATGTRIDHMLGNVGLQLKAIGSGIHLEIIDDHNRMFLIDKSTRFYAKDRGIISFHAISKVVKNINIRGAKYPLVNYDMTLFEPRAICNEFIGEDVIITFESGIIMVIFPKD